MRDCMRCGEPVQHEDAKLCDRCWELSTRIERDPELARKILADMDGEGPRRVKWSALFLSERIELALRAYESWPTLVHDPCPEAEREVATGRNRYDKARNDGHAEASREARQAIIRSVLLGWMKEKDIRMPGKTPV